MHLTRFSTDKDNISTPIGEFISSAHDVNSLLSFLLKFKFDYGRCYKENLQFYIICIDYAWISIHAILQSFNNENVIMYANRVYLLSKREISVNDSEMSWLCSCCAHTMKRFATSTKKIITNKIIQKCVCFMFSLLMNSKDLDSFDYYFKRIIIVLLSKQQTQLFNNCYNQLKVAINNRPEHISEFSPVIEKLTYKSTNNYNHEFDIFKDAEVLLIITIMIIIIVIMIMIMM